MRRDLEDRLRAFCTSAVLLAGTLLLWMFLIAGCVYTARNVARETADWVLPF